jgi:hypothetical protein
MDERPSNLCDLMQTLVDATGWDMQQALDMWHELCEQHPQFYNCWVDVTSMTAYVTQAQLFDIEEIEPSIEWATCVSEHVQQHKNVLHVDSGLLVAGSFYATIQWTAPRDNRPPKIAWLESSLDDQGNPCVDFDLLLQIKYALSAKQASALRVRNRTVDNDVFASVFKTVDSVGKTRWYTHVATIQRTLLKLTRKRNAEAERMHDHSVAQVYIEMHLCDVEVECGTCGSIDLVNVNGQRTKECKWNGFALDIGVLFGDDVVCAIEILNTSPVSAKKLSVLMKEGLPFAEVRATDILAACRDKVPSVRAVRGHGFCKRCKQTESLSLLISELAEHEDTERKMRKRIADAHDILADCAVKRAETRQKIRKLACTEDSYKPLQEETTRN